VVSADKNGVVVVMAEMREGKPVQASRAHEVHRQQWLALTGARAQQAHGFFELQVRKHQTASRDDSAAPARVSSTQLDELTIMDETRRVSAAGIITTCCLVLRTCSSKNPCAC